FSFCLSPEDAFGYSNQQAIVEVSKQTFIIDGEMRYDLMQKGKSISMLEKSGKKVTGIIMNVSDTHVRIDFNHPLAGKNLYFSGQILKVKKPSQEEIDKLNNHTCSCGGGCDCATEEKETCECDSSGCC
ncbi:peptidylprolyl isomerase, partial [Bacteroidota bacterium]